MNKFLLIIAIALCSFHAYAKEEIGSVDGNVVMVRVDHSGKGMVFFNINIGGTPPGCVHDSYKKAFAFDARTDGGKAVLAFALSAKATGSRVIAYGTGECGIYGGSVVETWDYGQLL